MSNLLDSTFGQSPKELLRETIKEANHIQCKCGETALKLKSVDPTLFTAIYKIECPACGRQTLWNQNEKCALCEWEETK